MSKEQTKQKFVELRNASQKWVDDNTEVGEGNFMTNDLRIAFEGGANWYKETVAPSQLQQENEQLKEKIEKYLSRLRRLENFVADIPGATNPDAVIKIAEKIGKERFVSLP